MYQQLFYAFSAGDNPSKPNDLGKKFILPATFQGGTCDMMENLQNSLAISSKYGPPDLFITATANPNWPEITNTLLPGQTVQDRPDLVSHVFYQKKLFLIDLIVNKNIFGGTVTHIHTIQFQKRGLPHIHLLIWLEKEYKIRTPAEVDSLISAEFSDPVTHPHLYKLVCDNMTHDPCGPLNPNAPCMIHGKCSKHYPKDFSEETTVRYI